MNEGQGRWYFGWNIVTAAALITLLSTGMRLGIGPFFLPITEDLQLSRSVLASIIATGMLSYGLAMPLAGYLVERLGTRRVILLGAAIVVGSATWAVYSRSWWEFMISFGILMSIGFSFTSPVALTPIISRWFTRQRGMALFFLSTGSMAGIGVMTPMLAYGIGQFGWRPTLFGFAVAFAALTLPVAFWVVRENAPARTDLLPGDPAPTPAQAAAAASPGTMRDAMSKLAFWQVFIGLFACGFSMNLMGTHAVPMLMDHGFSMGTSAHGVGLIGLVAIAGTLALGRIADKVQRRNLLAVIYFVRGLGFFALVAVGMQWELYLAATIGGIVWAGSLALSSAILADLYGVKRVGVLFGVTFLGHQIGGAISSWLGGWGYETFGTHWVAFGTAGGLLIGAAVVSLRLPLRQMPMRGAQLAAGR